MSQYAPLRLLTDLTGSKAGEDRPVIVGTVELTVPTLRAALISAIPALIAGSLGAALAGPVGFLAAFLIVMAAGIWLILGRSSAGLQRRNYERMADAMKYKKASFTLCGHPIEPHIATAGIIASSSVPLEPLETGGFDEAFTSAVRGRCRPDREVDIAAFRRPIRTPMARTARHHAGRSAPQTFHTGDVLAALETTAPDTGGVTS